MKNLLTTVIYISLLFSQMVVNYRVGSMPGLSEMEPTIAVNPNNNDQIFGVWIARDRIEDSPTEGVASLYYSVSGDGGQSWYTDMVPYPVDCFEEQPCDYSADPSVTFTNDGIINLLFLSKIDNQPNSKDVYHLKSTENFFETFLFSEEDIIKVTDDSFDSDADKVWVSSTINGVCEDKLYAAFSGGLAGEEDGIVVMEYVEEEWNYITVIPNQEFDSIFWPTTTTDNNGNVFIFWAEYQNWFEIGIVSLWGATKTCDGEFLSPFKIDEFSAPPMSDSYDEFAITSGAFPAVTYNQIENKIYIATQTIVENFNDKNISIYSSHWEDEELIWELTLPNQLNESENHQMLPWIASDEVGNIFIIYYDHEHGSTIVDTYIAGSTFDSNIFNIDPIKLNTQVNDGNNSGPVFEYIGISAVEDNIYGIWVDFEDTEDGMDVIISHLINEENIIYEENYLISENSDISLLDNSSIIINENSILTINKGSQLNFGENTSIEVYGELIINGEEGEEVEFTSEAGDYNIIAYEGSKLTFNHVTVENADHIELWNQSDETTFNNCTFDNNSFVLAIEGQPQFNNCTFSNNDAGLVTVSMTYPVAMPTVENCTFNNNDLTGMLSGYRSIPILKGNEFINNTQDGLRVSFGSEPYLFTNGADCESQNNLFDENNVGVRVYNSGLPWLGIYADGLTAFEGYNRLGSNTWDVYSENTQYPIYAQKNHWQNDQYNLCDSGIPTVYGDIITDPTISGDNYNTLVHNAINNEALGDYILAASQYVALVMEDPDSEIVKWAIAGLVRTYTKMNRKADLLTLLDQIRQNNPSTISHKYASTHHITQLIDNGDYDVALEQILELENLYPKSELTPKHLFEEWIIAEKTNGFSRSGQSKAQIADKLIADYPEDDFGITMSFIQGTSPTASNDENVISQDFLPTDFGLTNIYPNPFNPITNITYEIPEESNISISVYDLAGRKLEDLVTGTVQAGKFNTTLNAVNYPSGVYFVTMTTPNYTTSKKVVLLK